MATATAPPRQAGRSTTSARI